MEWLIQDISLLNIDTGRTIGTFPLIHCKMYCTNIKPFGEMMVFCTLSLEIWIPFFFSGSPSALCLGSGFRGHLVGVLELLVYYLMPSKCKNQIRSLLVCLSVLVAFKITKVEISCIITCDSGPYCSNFITCIRIYNAKKKKSWSREILIQKAPLPLVHSHSVSYGRFKRRLVDFLSIEYWTL